MLAFQILAVAATLVGASAHNFCIYSVWESETTQYFPPCGQGQFCNPKVTTNYFGWYIFRELADCNQNPGDINVNKIINKDFNSNVNVGRIFGSSMTNSQYGSVWINQGGRPDYNSLGEGQIFASFTTGGQTSDCGKTNSVVSSKVGMDSVTVTLIGKCLDSNGNAYLRK